jgi:hypothetical protein
MSTVALVLAGDMGHAWAMMNDPISRLSLQQVDLFWSAVDLESIIYHFAGCPKRPTASFTLVSYRTVGRIVIERPRLSNFKLLDTETLANQSTSAGQQTS